MQFSVFVGKECRHYLAITFPVLVLLLACMPLLKYLNWSLCSADIFQLKVKHDTFWFCFHVAATCVGPQDVAADNDVPMKWHQMGINDMMVAYNCAKLVVICLIQGWYLQWLCLQTWHNCTGHRWWWWLDQQHESWEFYNLRSDKF